MNRTHTHTAISRMDRPIRCRLLTCRMTTRPICRGSHSGCGVNIDPIQHGRLSASVGRLIRQVRASRRSDFGCRTGHFSRVESRNIH